MKLPRYLPAYIVVLFIITLALRIVLIGYYNNNLGGIELNVVYGIQRLLLGQPLYQDPISGSYAVIQYTPLYYHLVAALGRLAGISGLHVQSVFVLCRIVALSCNLITVLLCANIIKGLGFTFKQSLLCALPILIVLTSHYYTRGDSLHLLLFTSAIGAYTSYSRSGKLHSLLLSALCAAACIMTKQSGLLCVGIVGFCLLFIERKMLPLLINIASTGLFTFLIAATCLQGSTIKLSYLNAWLGLKNGTDLSFLSNMFLSQYFTDLIPFYLLGCFMVYFAFTKSQNKTYRILAISAVLSFLFAFATGLKKGSSNNYFTEYLVLVLLALPHLLMQASEQKLSLKIFNKNLSVFRLALIALFILITSKTMGFFSGVCIERGYKNNKEQYAKDAALLQYFENELQLKDGEKVFFTERRFLDNLFIKYAIMPTKDVTSMVYMADHNTYNFISFTTGMNRGLIKYIITDEHRDDINICNDSLPFVRFDKQKFRLVRKIYGYSIYAYLPSL